MRRPIAIAAVLILTGCGMYYRAAEHSQPADIAFKGPLRPVKLTPSQIKTMQAGIRASLEDPAAASFSSSYRAGVTSSGSIAACGFVNGKRFVGVFAKPVGSPLEFLPIKVGTNEGNEEGIRRYCRVDGIYLPQ